MQSYPCLFSPQGPTQSTGFKRETLTEDDLIKGLRQYISKNRIIPDFFAAVNNDLDRHADNLTMLANAINSADFAASIFDHADCSNYLLYLIEHKKIPFWLGMSAYTYLMTLAQFTNRQQVREQEVKSLRAVKPTSLVEGERLSEYGEQYLQLLVIEFAAINIKIDMALATKFILSLSRFEQHLLVVQIHFPYIEKTSVNQTDEQFVEAVKLIKNRFSDSIDWYRDKLKSDDATVYISNASSSPKI